MSNGLNIANLGVETRLPLMPGHGPGLGTGSAPSRVATPGSGLIATTARKDKVAGGPETIAARAGTLLRPGEFNRIADGFFAKDALDAVAAAGRAQAEAGIDARLNQIAQRLTPVGEDLARFTKAFEALKPGEGSAEDEAGRKADAIRAVATLFNRLNSARTEALSLAADTDERIAALRAEIDTHLSAIETQNARIVQATLDGRPTDQAVLTRNETLRALARIADVRAIPREGGAIDVAGFNGTVLLDTIGNRARNFTPTAGELGGLLLLRRGVVPVLAEEIGELSKRLAVYLNARYATLNAAPADKIAGPSVGIDGGDDHQFTGRLGFAALDGEGKILRLAKADFSSRAQLFGAPAALAGANFDKVAGEITQRLQGAGAVSFAGGKFTFEAKGEAKAVALVEDPDQPAQRAGLSFADFFELNPLVTGGSREGRPTGFDAKTPHLFGADQTITLRFEGPKGQIERNLPITGASFGDLINGLNDLQTGFGEAGSFSLDRQGRILAYPAAGWDMARLTVVADSTDRAGTGISFSTLFNIPPSGQDPQWQVRPDLAANPAGLALGVADPAALGQRGQTLLAGRERAGAERFLDLTDATFTFEALGTLPTPSRGLAEQAILLGATHAARAAGSQERRETQTGRAREIGEQITETHAHSFDEHLRQMAALQNAAQITGRLSAAASGLMMRIDLVLAAADGAPTENPVAA